MKTPRLLIVGINYAPEPTGIAVNTTGLAEGLGNRGWDVTVVTGIPHYPSWKPGYAPRTEQSDSVHVIHCRHFVPPHPSVPLRAAYELSWVTSCLPVTLRHRAVDVVLGVTPSLGGALLAALGASRWRVPYVVMFQDLMGPALRQCRIQHAERVAKVVGECGASLCPACRGDSRGRRGLPTVPDGRRHCLGAHTPSAKSRTDAPAHPAAPRDSTAPGVVPGRVRRPALRQHGGKARAGKRPPCGCSDARG